MKKLLTILFLIASTIPAFADYTVMGKLTTTNEVVKKNITVEAGGYYYGDGRYLTNITSTNSAFANYATLAGTATTAGYATLSGLASTSAYATLSGTSTLSGYANLSGTSTIAGYATLAGSSSLDAQKWLYINRDGFTSQDNTVTFDASAYNFYISPTGTTWQYMRQGTLETVTGAKTINIGNPPSTGLYYIYITDEAGNLGVSNSSWTLTDNNIPIAIINWNAGCSPKYWLQTERHTSQMDRRTHWYLHFTRGAQPLTIGALSGYTVAPAVPADANNTFTIEASAIADEDLQKNILKLSNPSVTTSNRYYNFFPVGSSYSWEALTTPFRYTAAGYIQYNASGVMTQGGGNKFINSYLLQTSISGEAGFMIIPGQNEYSSLANARSEDPSQFSWTGFNIPEAVIVKKFIWETSAAYSSTGKCRLATDPISITIGVTASTGNISMVHNSLSGLQGGALGQYYHLTASQESIFQANNISTTGYITAETLKATTYIGIPAGTSVGSAGATSLTGAITFDATGLIRITQAGQRINFGTVSSGTSEAEVIPIGTVVAIATSEVPQYWLECNGQAVSRATYADLFAKILTRYGTGDGTTTFNVPNYQGLFLRGKGSQTVSGITYISTIGATTLDMLQGHEHIQWNAQNDTGGTIQANNSSVFRSSGINGTFPTDINIDWTLGTLVSMTTGGLTYDASNGIPRIGTETRPVNSGVMYIIKALRNDVIYNLVTAPTPAGSAGQIQFNNGTITSAESGLTWEASTDTLYTTNIKATTLYGNGANITGYVTASALTTAGTVDAGWLKGDGSQITGLSGSGTVTTLYAGSGITMSPSPITTTGIISATASAPPFQLVTSVTTIGAVTALITGLDGNTDKNYYITVTGTWDSADGYFMYIRPNRDSTTAYKGTLYFNYTEGGTLGYAWTTNLGMYIGRHGYDQRNSVATKVNLRTDRLYSSKVILEGSSGWFSDTSGGISAGEFRVGGGWTGTANVTSLEVSVNNGTFTGVINVYKGLP